MRITYGEGRKKPTIKQAINLKLKVLREFGIVNDANVGKIKADLRAAVDANPNRDYEVVLDQIANSMIVNA